MINLNGITAVRERIAEIEQQFGMPQNPLTGADFASKLQKEMAKMRDTAKVDNTPNVTATEKQNAAAATKNIATTAETAAANLPANPLNGINADAKISADDVAASSPLKSAFAAAKNALNDADNAATGTTYQNSTADESTVAKMLTDAATKYGLSDKLVNAIAEAESNKNQSAISSAGAIGVMQLMPDTAAALGVNPYDIAQNIDGGAKYIRQMLDNFGGDVQKAIAAYNAGPQAVRDYGGIPPYAETQNYVERVLDLYR